MARLGQKLPVDMSALALEAAVGVISGKRSANDPFRSFHTEDGITQFYVAIAGYVPL